MAYTPLLPEVRYLLANYRWLGEVLAVAPHSSIPQYPNPIRGDRYFDTTYNKVIECRVDRRWTEAIGTTPTPGSVYALRSTGDTYIMAQDSSWQPYDEFLKAVGDELGGGGGGGIEKTATFTTLKLVATAGLTDGDQIVVLAVPVYGDGGFTLPGIYVWDADFDATDPSEFPNQDEDEPVVVIPTAIWGSTKTGAWTSIPMLAISDYEDGGSYTRSLPVNNLPTTLGPDDDGSTYLTGPDYVDPGDALKVATWSGTAWSFETPADGDEFYVSKANGKTYLRYFDDTPSYWAIMSSGGSDNTFPNLIIGAAARESSESGHGSFESGTPFLVWPEAKNDWAGHAQELAWEDGDGSGWLFSGDVLTPSPWGGFPETPGVLWAYTNTAGFIPFRYDTGAMAWVPQSGTFVAGDLDQAGVPPSPIDLLMLPNFADGREVVAEIIVQSNPAGILIGMTVNTGTRLDGDASPGNDIEYIKFMTDNHNIQIEFTGDGTTGTASGIFVVEGQAYPFTVEWLT
jgi:hypothetical protein